MTTYERKIYDAVTASREHLTVEQIFTLVRKTHPGIALATVYNNVNKLCEAGLIRRISVEGSPDRYDRVQKHDHLVCKRCGRLADVTFDDLTAPLRKAVGGAFLYYDLKVFYLCPQCRGEAPSAPPETDGPN